MIFNSTPIAGVAIIDLEARSDDRGFFARVVRPRRVRRRGPRSARRAGEHLVQPHGGHAARHALPGLAASRDEARPLHARRDRRHDRRHAVGLADPAAARLGRADGRQPPRALRARVLRARLPDAGRRHRGDLSWSAAHTRPAPSAGCATTTRPSASSWPLPVDRHLAEGCRVAAASRSGPRTSSPP